MRFSIQREALLRRLQQVVGVVERRQTLPVLANLLVNVDAGGVALTGTDLEVEMVARTEADDLDAGEVTVPARKLFDIVRALPSADLIVLEKQPDMVAGQANPLVSLPGVETMRVRAWDLPLPATREDYDKALDKVGYKMPKRP